MLPRRADTVRRAPLALALAALLLPSAATAAEDAAPDDATRLDEVVVVGSRIRRSEAETQQPVFVIERAQIERTGLVSVGDLLQDLTTHGAALNTGINNGGNGQERVDLRNLGDNRTLVLLDGRRLNRALDGGVDLSAIPLAIVDRIEVLKDGASTIYGSDAIAGVVAIHTRDDVDDVRVSTYVGGSEHGDGRVQRHEAAVGRTGERASVALTASWTEQDAIFAGDRAISAVPVFGAPATSTEAGASPSGPNGRFGFGPRGSCAFNAAGTYPAAGCRDPGRAPTLPATTFDPATGAYRVFERATDGFNFAPDNYLQTPYERGALFAKARFDVTDTTRATLDVLYNDRGSAQLLAASPVVLGVQFGGLMRHAVPAGHVFNPFGQPVNAIALRPGGQQRRFRQDADTWRVAAGLEGSREVFGRWWTWRLDVLHADQKFAQDRSGNIDLPKLLLALGPSFRDAAGVARCGTPATPLDGCVPFDAFHGEAGITEAMRDYLYFASNDTRRGVLDDFTADVTGDVMDLPAGPLAVAAGLGVRHERARFRPDEKLRLADVSAGVQGVNDPIAGSSRVREAYVELAVPLLAERPFAHALDLSLAARFSDYDRFGGTTNAKAGFRWAPVPSVTVRGNWTEGFRAPSLVEAFGPPLTSQGPTDVFDPCSSLLLPDPATRANCSADGVPGGVYESTGTLFDAIGGGNAALRPETAIDRTLGVVWSPESLAGFDVALDWYRIEIADAISGVDTLTVLDACSREGVPEACARTTRDPTGRLVAVDSRNLNSGALDLEAYDLTVHWRADTALGRFDVVWDSTYTARYVTEVPRGVEPNDVPGNYRALEPGWRWRSNLDVAWRRGAFGAAAGVRHYPGLDEACPFVFSTQRALCTDPDLASPTFDAVGENRIGSTTYVDLQASWESPWDGRLSVGLRNAFDRDPPIARSGFANSFDPAYPIPGRFWYVGWEQRF